MACLCLSYLTIPSYRPGFFTGFHCTLLDFVAWRVWSFVSSKLQLDAFSDKLFFTFTTYCLLYNLYIYHHCILFPTLSAPTNIFSPPLIFAVAPSSFSSVLAVLASFPRSPSLSLSLSHLISRTSIFTYPFLSFFTRYHTLSIFTTRLLLCTYPSSPITTFSLYPLLPCYAAPSLLPPLSIRCLLFSSLPIITMFVSM